MDVDNKILAFVLKLILYCVHYKRDVRKGDLYVLNKAEVIIDIIQVRQNVVDYVRDL